MDFPPDAHPSDVCWAAIADLAPHITSWLDIGAGHSGVFALHHADRLPHLERREVLDIGPVRELPPGWVVRQGDARDLWEHYSPGEFDVVICTEVWEHLDWWAAMFLPEMMTQLARRAVVLTTTDETKHVPVPGNGQYELERINPHQRFQRCWQEYPWLWSAEQGWQARLSPDGHILMAVWRPSGSLPGWHAGALPLAGRARTARAEWSHLWREPALTP